MKHQHYTQVINTAIMLSSKEVIQYKTKDGNHLQNVKSHFETISLSEAIEQASKAIDPTNNKIFSHQRRIGKTKASEGYELIKVMELDLKACTTFEEIMLITDEVIKNIPRLGNLSSYDTALRIGFHLRIYPKDVYIQAGVVKGYVKLFNKKPMVRKIAKSEFSMLAELEAYEIENFFVFGVRENGNLREC